MVFGVVISTSNQFVYVIKIIDLAKNIKTGALLMNKCWECMGQMEQEIGWNIFAITKDDFKGTLLYMLKKIERLFFKVLKWTRFLFSCLPKPEI